MRTNRIHRRFDQARIQVEAQITTRSEVDEISAVDPDASTCGPFLFADPMTDPEFHGIRDQTIQEIDPLASLQNPFPRNVSALRKPT
jgi:hypothetical protein